MSEGGSASGAAPEKRLTGMIHELSLMVARLFNRQMREFGLTRTQWQVLYWLSHEDGQSQTGLAETLFMARPPLGRVVDRLEEQGWIVRRDDPKDRRVKLVFLTDKFTPMRAPLDAVVNEMCDVAMAGMAQRERKQLSTLLARMHENLSDVVETGRYDARGNARGDGRGKGRGDGRDNGQRN
jgi:MarR family transcriptional regulator for hemolysin